MNIKALVKYFIVIVLVCLAGYLIFDLVSGDAAQKKDVLGYCTEKCSYNQSSLYWEFSRDTGVKGFTTKDECFNYCSQSREGFVYRLVSESYASLVSSPPLSDFLKFIQSK